MTNIKIVSGWSAAGGSTVHFINLTNLFNNNGIDCTFYGPNGWHLDKCKSGKIRDAIITNKDILISHFIEIPNSVQWKQNILSCHETEIFPLKDRNIEKYDLIHFVSNWQKKWHSVNHPSIVIPPVVEKIEWKGPNKQVAGIIGSIDKNKRTHEAIQYAIQDGYNTILLFGLITDSEYYEEKVKKFIDFKKVTLIGHVDDKSKMYNSVDAVYHSSMLETYGLVEAECELAGIPFIKNGVRRQSTIQILSDDEILELWKKYLDLE